MTTLMAPKRQLPARQPPMTIIEVRAQLRMRKSPTIVLIAQAASASWNNWVVMAQDADSM